MDLHQLIPLGIQLSIALVVFGVALEADFNDLTYLVRHPGLLVRSLLAMFVVMPVLAVGLAVTFDLNPLVEVALIAFALSPVPPVLPKKQIKAGGAPSYVVGLLAIASLVAVVYVPAAVELLEVIFGRPLHVPATAVAKLVALQILVPLVAGVVVARLAPSFALRGAKPISVVATLLLLAAKVPILVIEWPLIAALIGNYSIVAIALFSLAGLAVGHALGGPRAEERTVLALSTSTRHPGIAIAVAANVADKEPLLGAVLLVLLVAALVSLPYVVRRGRSSAQRPTTHRARPS
jgi:BASS family bile acid:Na+ symporter